VTREADRNEGRQDIDESERGDPRIESVAPKSSVIDLQRLYRNRSSELERGRKDEIWRVLCTHFFQRYVQPSDVVLDIASGMGEFSRHITAAKVYAVDINPDAAEFLPAGSIFSLTSAERLDFLSDNSVDVAFTSNFLEHLPTKAVVDAVLSAHVVFSSHCSPTCDTHTGNIGISTTITRRCLIFLVRRLSNLLVFE
jgi:SAM-dependent methyltransferase